MFKAIISVYYVWVQCQCQLYKRNEMATWVGFYYRGWWPRSHNTAPLSLLTFLSHVRVISTLSRPHFRLCSAQTGGGVKSTFIVRKQHGKQTQYQFSFFLSFIRPFKAFYAFYSIPLPYHFSPLPLHWQSTKPITITYKVLQYSKA